MSFSDIFKKSFLEGYSSASIDTKTIAICLCITAVIALYIFFIYRAVTRKTFYEKTFNISLIGMAVITSAIILTVQSNIVISLGMVGALSIVRFRTAIKDPLDLVFLYWSISVGIICGAGMAEISIVLSLVLTVVVFLMQKYPNKKMSMILVVNSTAIDADSKVLEIVKNYSKYYKIKSKNMTGSSLDMIVEVKVNEESELVHKIMEIEGITSASLLSHDGEITA
jgi:uncharacterized membrane protein YhiD involved in acid resistance